MRQKPPLVLLLVIIHQLPLVSSFAALPYVHYDYAHLHRLAHCRAKCLQKYGEPTARTLDDGTKVEGLRWNGEANVECDEGCSKTARFLTTDSTSVMFAGGGGVVVRRPTSPTRRAPGKSSDSDRKTAFRQGTAFWQAASASADATGTSPLAALDILCISFVGGDSSEVTFSAKLAARGKSPASTATVYVVQWRQRTQAAGFLDDTAWMAAVVERGPLFSVDGLLPAVQYRFQVTAIGPEGRLGTPIVSDWLELPENFVPAKSAGPQPRVATKYDSENGASVLVEFRHQQDAKDGARFVTTAPPACGYEMSMRNETFSERRRLKLDEHAALLLPHLAYAGNYRLDFRPIWSLSNSDDGEEESAEGVDDLSSTLYQLSNRNDRRSLHTIRFSSLSCYAVHGHGTMKCPPEPVADLKFRRSPEIVGNSSSSPSILKSTWLEWKTSPGAANVLTFQISYESLDPKCATEQIGGRLSSSSTRRTFYVDAAARRASLPVSSFCAWKVKVTLFDLVGREAAAEIELPADGMEMFALGRTWRASPTAALLLLAAVAIAILLIGTAVTAAMIARRRRRRSQARRLDSKRPPTAASSSDGGGPKSPLIATTTSGPPSTASPTSSSSLTTVAAGKEAAQKGILV